MVQMIISWSEYYTRVLDPVHNIRGAHASLGRRRWEIENGVVTSDRDSDLSQPGWWLMGCEGSVEDWKLILEPETCFRLGAVLVWRTRSMKVKRWRWRSVQKPMRWLMSHRTSDGDGEIEVNAQRRKVTRLKTSDGRSLPWPYPRVPPSPAQTPLPKKSKLNPRF